MWSWVSAEQGGLGIVGPRASVLGWYKRVSGEGPVSFSFNGACARASSAQTVLAARAVNHTNGPSAA